MKTRVIQDEPTPPQVVAEAGEDAADGVPTAAVADEPEALEQRAKTVEP
jgi:hypothetical protein